jgi:hypothetical protein
MTEIVNRAWVATVQGYGSLPYTAWVGAVHRCSVATHQVLSLFSLFSLFNESISI